MNYPLEIQNLPICTHLDDICEKLKASESHSLVLTAETGAGKSTALPLALLEHFNGKILMLEPRRIAVLNIASRVSDLLEESVGKTCGYRMRFESKESDETRIQILTDAILTRMIQSDPLLEGVSVVVIDEFHERSIHADLALAFLKEALELREDLYLVVMSATMDTDSLSTYLGTDDKKAPVYFVPGRTHRVQISYEEKKSPAKAAYDALNLIEENAGSVLVFLPGLKEIRKVQKDLLEMSADRFSEICILHSSVPFEEQKRILKTYTNGKRIILSSAIAETSVTVPDVQVVVDSGECRLNVYNQNLCMDQLLTMRVSEFSAAQRAGRAGRVKDGFCIRLWNKNDKLVQDQLPEIMRSDLSALVLECGEWGAKDIESINWFSSPSKGSWEAAKSLLENLGCMKEGKPTPLGKAVISLGLGVRLGCVALSGFPSGNSQFSTGIAIELDKSNFVDIKTKEKQALIIKKRCQIYEKNPQVFTGFPQNKEYFSTAYALLCGYPDRIAKKTSENSYLFPSGRIAVLAEKNEGHFPDYLIATDISAGDRQGFIREWTEIDEEKALSFMEKHSKIQVKTEFIGDSQKLKKKEFLSYGKIVLKQKDLTVSSKDYLAAVKDAVETNGLEWLPLSNSAKNLLLRCQFYIQQDKSESRFMENRYNSLVVSVDQWLFPFVPEDEKINEQKVYSALYYYLDGDSLNKSVPVELVLPNGKKRKLCYENQNGKIIPVLEIIIQQIFGCFTTPRVMGYPVLLRLLSPARRPLQVTSDLENFWKETWPEICSEMKGRYPKHNWDYRMTTNED